MQNREDYFPALAFTPPVLMTYVATPPHCPQPIKYTNIVQRQVHVHSNRSNDFCAL